MEIRDRIKQCRDRLKVRNEMMDKGNAKLTYSVKTVEDLFESKHGVRKVPNRLNTFERKNSKT